MPSRFVDTCMHYISKAIDTGKLHYFEYQLPFPDEAGYYEARLVPYGENRVLGLVRNITDRILAEQALKESEEKYRALVESGPMSILLLRDGKYIYGNPASAVLLGHNNPDDIIGVPALKPIAPEFHDIVRKRLRRISRGKENSPVELRLVKPNGESIWTLSTSVSIIMDGKPTAFIMSQDVTRQKRAQDSLRESEELFRTVFDQAAVGVAQAAPDGSFLQVNSTFCKIVGYEREELDKLTFRSITHPDDLYLDDEQIARVIARETDLFEIEKRYIHKHGHTVWIKLYSNAARNSDGSIKYAVAVVTDITNQKKAEEALRDSELLFRSITEQTSDMISLTDENGIVTYTSPSCQETIRFPARRNGRPSFHGVSGRIRRSCCNVGISRSHLCG